MNQRVDSLADDLQTLTRTSNPVDFVNLRTPRLAAEETRTGLDTADLIAAATDQIADDAVRRSAEQLFNFSNRTESFTHRSRLAAEQMGISLDGFRRRGDGRPSRRDLVILELAQQVVAVSDADVAGSTESRPDDDSDHSSNLGRRLALVSLIAMVIVVAGAIGARSYIRSVQADRLADLARDVPGDLDMTLYCTEQYGENTISEPQGSGWVCRDADDQSNPISIDPDQVCATQYGESTRALALNNSAGAWRCELTAPVANSQNCDIAPGAFDASMADTMSPFAQGFRQRHGQDETLPCPTNIMHRWADGILQELGSDTEQSALIALSPETIILLDGSAWAAFDRIKGITGSLVGYPLNEPEPRHDGLVVELSADGALFASGEQSTFHWLPPVVYQHWIEHMTCLGPPVSDPYTNGDHFRQDFLHDSLVLNPSTISFHALGDC